VQDFGGFTKVALYMSRDGFEQLVVHAYSEGAGAAC
jgi:hypothetical protein